MSILWRVVYLCGPAPSRATQDTFIIETRCMSLPWGVAATRDSERVGTWTGKLCRRNCYIEPRYQTLHIASSVCFCTLHLFLLCITTRRMDTALGRVRAIKLWICINTLCSCAQRFSDSSACWNSLLRELSVCLWHTDKHVWRQLTLVEEE